MCKKKISLTSTKLVHKYAKMEINTIWFHRIIYAYWNIEFILSRESLEIMS